jgi:hypothetical protein
MARVALHAPLQEQEGRKWTHSQLVLRVGRIGGVQPEKVRLTACCICLDSTAITGQLWCWSLEEVPGAGSSLFMVHDDRIHERLPHMVERLDIGCILLQAL